MSPSIAIAESPAGILNLLASMANRHGCITGATGTGKTVTLQRLAEGFSQCGVPVFLADVKGDLSGLSQAGSLTPKLQARLSANKWDAPAFAACPTAFWDVLGQQGHPIRATVSDLGPLLLGRMLDLNETQEGVLHLVFRVADDNGWLLLDLKDLRAMLQYVGEQASALRTEYGQVSAASIGAIQRGLLRLEQEGADQFFGEPMLDIADMMQTVDGQGVVNILSADRLLQRPRLYATFLLWMLSELYENLPEAGDLDKPKFVFFFDEAHLLFSEAPKVLLERIEQVVRLIRSKGVGVYFVTQSPSDVPASVLGQLGNRVQHALRAFTPADRKAVQAAADSLRPNPAFDASQAITELGVGEALVSCLDEAGRPLPVERAWILPPLSRIGPATAVERQAVLSSSLVAGVYEATQDRESAYEQLKSRAAAGPVKDAARDETAFEQPGQGGWLKDVWEQITGAGGRRESVAEAMAKSAARSIGSSVGREIVRGVLGSLLGSPTRSRRRR